MSQMDKYINAFVEALSVEKDQVIGLAYQVISEWDSVGHMSLISALEEAFDIMLDTEDIIDLSSFQKGIEILAKYGIEIE